MHSNNPRIKSSNTRSRGSSWEAWHGIEMDTLSGTESVPSHQSQPPVYDEHPDVKRIDIKPFAGTFEVVPVATAPEQRVVRDPLTQGV